MGSAQFDTDDGDIIQTIQDSVRTAIINDLEGKEFVTRPVHLLPEKKQAERLVVHSLTAIVDYLKSGFDKGLLDGCTVIVASPTEVEVQCPIAGRTDRRFSPLAAEARLPTISFGHFMSLEEANITLQSRFAQTEERDDLISSLSRIVATETLEQADDGTSQEVTMKAGIRRTNDTVKNPVDLCPFRTFAEVNQPESPFVVRLRKPNDEGMTVAFFEADGGAWRKRPRVSRSRNFSTRNWSWNLSRCLRKRYGNRKRTTEQFAVVEMMGHRKICGAIKQSELAPGRIDPRRCIWSGR
jgi:hypothetical protein